MKQGIVILNSLVLFTIALIHFYWAFGGKKWLNYALPTNPNPNVSFDFKPGFFSTIVVGLGLMGFSIIIFLNITKYHHAFTNLLLTRIIATVFIARAVGDFNYVGIKKKVTNTVFARKDSQIYVPLCFWLGLSTVLISII